MGSRTTFGNGNRHPEGNSPRRVFLRRAPPACRNTLFPTSLTLSPSPPQISPLRVSTPLLQLEAVSDGFLAPGTMASPTPDELSDTEEIHQVVEIQPPRSFQRVVLSPPSHFSSVLVVSAHRLAARCRVSNGFLAPTQVSRSCPGKKYGEEIHLRRV